MQVVGVLGGTFDPVHCGHLRLALEMHQRLALDRVHLIPVRTPPHRDAPVADASMRLRMLQASVENLSILHVDDRELRRKGPSYSVETLLDLREEFPDVSLCFLLGMDAFVTLPSWHRWQELPELTHIGVACRPGSAPPREGAVAELLEARRTDDYARLRSTQSGCVFVSEVPSLDISASRIRELVKSGHNPRFLVPDAVLAIIATNGVYADRH